MSVLDKYMSQPKRANPLQKHMSGDTNPLKKHMSVDMSGATERPLDKYMSNKDGIVTLPPKVEEYLQQSLNPNFLSRIANFFTPDMAKTFKALDVMEGLTKEQKEEYLKRVSKPIVKEALGTLEIGPRFGYGMLKGRTFHLPDLVMNLAGIKAPEPLSPVSDVAERIGSLFGLGGAIKQMVGWAPFTWLAKWMPATKWGVFTSRILKGGLKIGAYSMLSEHGGKDFIDNAKRRGVAFGSGAAVGAVFASAGMITSDGIGKILKLPDKYSSFTAFAMRMGINQYFTGYDSYKRFKKNEESLPGLIYSVGLGWMFSMSENPLSVEAEFNRSMKRGYQLKKLTPDTIAKKAESFGDWTKVPMDLKWAYVIKATDGKVMPTQQNAGAIDYIFQQAMKVNHVQTHNKLKLYDSIRSGLTEEYAKVLTNELEYVKQQGLAKAKAKKPPKKITLEQKTQMMADRKEIMIAIGKARRSRIKGTVLEKVYREKAEEIYKYHIKPLEKLLQKPVNLYSKKSWLFNIINQEENMRKEIATGQDVAKLNRTAKAVGLVYKSKSDKEVRTNLNKFLQAYYGVTSKDIHKLTVEQIEEARQFMKGLQIDPFTGRAKIPKSQAILPMEVFEWGKQPGNWFDWFQTARLPLRPIYDLMKPAYIKYLNTREAKLKELQGIYKNRIKQGGKVDELLARYADGKIPIEKIPEQYRGIARDRQKFYDTYADKLIEKGLLPRDKVYKKDGTRKPYYHRIMEDTITQIYNAGFAFEDYWMPGHMPLAGPLRARKGGGKIRYSALESDQKYVYAIEKYLNLEAANTASIAYAKLLKGVRKDMSTAYIRYMRGQPTKTDRNVKEAVGSIANWTADLAEKVGFKDTAKRLRDWQPPSYPVSRVASPIARFYYWRYVGLALDTSLKNSIQWHHALAKHGPKYTSQAAMMQFTEKGKRIIKASGIQDDGIRRGAHFISETNISRRMNKLEVGSYWMWSMFDKNNRNISGLAAYLAATDKGLTYENALTEMRNTSRETQYGYCVDSETECLTINGWKKYNELNIGDKIFTLNLTTNKLELQPIEEVGIFDYSGDMLHLKNTSLDKIMTPNHRCVIRDKKDKNKMVKAHELKYSHRIARVAEYNGNNGCISDDIVRLIGWSVTEGNLAKFRNCRTPRNYRIYQSLSYNPQHCQTIIQLLDRLGGHYNTTIKNRDKKTTITWSLRKPLSDELYKWIPHNRLTTDVVLKLTKVQLEILLQTMIDGDGSRDKHNGGMWFSQCLRKKQNIDNLQILAYLAGYTCTIYPLIKDDSGTYFIAYMSKRTQNTQVGKCKKEIIKYSGKIWCPVVNNGTWVAKRNSKIFITGNSKADSLLMDMATPLSRFILFKKWPLAKVEMIRQWSRDGHKNAILNLALTEYIMYRTAQGLGVDMGPYFSAVWRLATRGMESPVGGIPLAAEIATVYKAFGTGAEADKAKNKLIRAWQGLGNRWLGKTVDVWKAWKNDWKILDYKGRLKWEVTPKEAALGLFFRPMETTKRTQNIKKMLKLGVEIKDMRNQIVRLRIAGKYKEAATLQTKMFSKYGKEYFNVYGKQLQPVSGADVLRYKKEAATPLPERIRKRLPGRGLKVPIGQEFKPFKKPKQTPASVLRGY